MLPEIQTIQTKDGIISNFKGLNQKDTSNDEMFKDMLNMTSDEYPYLAVREKSAIREVSDTTDYTILGSVVYGEDLYTVRIVTVQSVGTVKLYKNYTEVSGVNLVQNNKKRQLKVFGAYIVIFPDNIIFNTKDNTATAMSYEQTFTLSSDNNRLYLSDKDGVPFFLDYTTKNSEVTPADQVFTQILEGNHQNIRTTDILISTHLSNNYFKDSFCKYIGVKNQEYIGQEPHNLWQANLMFSNKAYVLNNRTDTTYPLFWIEKSGEDYFIKRYQEQNSAWYPADLYVSWRISSSDYNNIRNKIKIGDVIKLHAVKSNNADYTENDFNGKEATWNLVEQFKKGLKVENIIKYTNATTASDSAVVLVFSNANLNFLKVLEEYNRYKWKYIAGTEQTPSRNELQQLFSSLQFAGGSNDIAIGYKVKLEKTVPAMDYITVSQNRIWGCSSANHEVYACKQGDATSWYQYVGLSSDSYAVTIPNGDVFTGAVTYNDVPYFFTENMCYAILGNKPKNYQVQKYPVRGVEKGAYRTLAQKDGYVYYKSKSGIERFNGSTSQSLTDYLDMEGVTGITGEVNNGKYFVYLRRPNPSMQEDDRLYVYDIQKGLWHIDRADYGEDMFELDNNLYKFDSAFEGFKIIKINGKAKEISDLLTDNSVSVTYDNPKWFVESGEFNGDSVLNKYITKFMFEMKLEQGSKLSISFMYDDSGEWEKVFRTTDKQAKKLMKVPIKVRRCERLRYKIEGEGKARIYSAVITFEGGSENG